MYKNNVLHRLVYFLVLLFPVFLYAQPADLELNMSSNNPQVGIYDYITITTTLSNTGAQSVDNVVVNFDIPTNVAIAGEFPPNAEQGSHEGFYGGSTQGNWFVGEVGAGQTLTFELTFFTLSTNPITFYGQVFLGADNDQDSMPGNGTCCTADEDDEAAYTFPNDGPGCTFDQAYGEIICNDNGTPDNPSDDSYTLRFRADGSNGEFTLFVPELNYSQTSAYNIGFTELTQLSLDIENLTLIFADIDATEGCGQTLSLSAPACGDVIGNCEIVYNEISNTVDDMGTPDNIFDDTFTIVYTIENEGGGTGFVGQFGGQFCGQVPSTGTYGVPITFTANLANWGNGSTVGCTIVDNENPDCIGGYSLLPNVECGFGNTCADLELRAANTPTPDVFQTANAQFIIENEFNGSNPADGTESGVQISFNKIGLNVVGVPTVSQGSIDLYWTDNPVWNVGELAPNETAIIDFELFTVSANYSLFGEVSAQSLTDSDSTPGNGNGITPQEDDEAVYTNSGTTEMAPDFVVSNLVIQNSPIAVGNVLTFSYDFTNQGDAPWPSSSTTRYWISTDAILSADDLAGGATFSNVGIAAGETYTVTNGQSSVDVSLADGDYFLIVQADELDVVLESNETNNTTAAPFTISNSTPCNLTISDTQLTCAENSTNSPFVYAIEVNGAIGNTVYYEVLGTSFSGTIITGQLVDIATLPQGLDFTISVTDSNNPVCEYLLTTNIPVAPGACLSDCSINITELARTCVDFGNPSSDINITATAVSSTGNPMNVTVNGFDAGTIESGVSTIIYTTGQGAILDNIVFTDVTNSTCTATTSSFQSIFPNECADVSCSIFEPQISNVSCTESTLTFDVLVSGNNLSNNLELRAGATAIVISPDVLTTVTVPRDGPSTEIVVIDLSFSPSPIQDFCIRQFFVDCTPDPVGGADVILSVSNNQNTPTGIYQAGEAIFTLTNTGSSPATGLVVTFSKNQVNITGTPTTSAGTPQFHWTNNPVWQVGTLAPGQSELIVFPVFTVGETFGLYGELTEMNETDSDSTPNNGNGNTPIEDDEALWPTNNPTPEFPDLVILNTTLTINSTEIGGTIDYSFTIENQGDAPNMSDFVYTGFVTDDSSISTPYSVQGTTLITEVINPGESITRSGTFTINSNVPSGYNYFGIIVDGGANVPESNEDNNIYLDGLFFFDEANNPCMIDLELVNINCTEAEDLYDITVAMNAVNLFPINQTYTVLNGEFLGVAFSGDSDVRTFFDIPLDQITTISTTDSAGDCIDDSLIIEVDPDSDCDVISQGVDLELTVESSATTVPIYSTYSLTYTLSNVGNEEATGIFLKSPRNFDVVYEGGNEFSVSQGSFDFLGANNSFWNVGSLAAGESATLTVNFFTLETGSITNWAYVIAQNEPDFDSEPNEWTCCVPVEDDEAGIIVAVTSNFTGENPAALTTSATMSTRAYPVPAQDYLTVDIISETSEAAIIQILDVTGRSRIIQETLELKGRQTVEIPVIDLEKGVYLLSIRKGEETIVQRFVKM